MANKVDTAIRRAFSQRTYLFTLHAVHQTEERRITSREIEQAVLSDAGEEIEDYPDDSRGPSCLILGTTEAGRMLHVHVSRPPQVWVITAYEPSQDRWTNGKTRR